MLRRPHQGAWGFPGAQRRDRGFGGKHVVQVHVHVPSGQADRTGSLLSPRRRRVPRLRLALLLVEQGPECSGAGVLDGDCDAVGLHSSWNRGVVLPEVHLLRELQMGVRPPGPRVPTRTMPRVRSTPTVHGAEPHIRKGRVRLLVGQDNHDPQLPRTTTPDAGRRPTTRRAEHRVDQREERLVGGFTASAATREKEAPASATTLT